MKTSTSVGLNGVSPAAYNGWSGDLLACDSDATGNAAVFATLGYTSKAIFDSGSTLAAIRALMTAAAATTGPGDWFVMTYSGHGGQAESWAFNGYQETLCLYDGQMPDSELHNLLTAFQPGVNVVIILDCCHSGGMDKAGPPINRVRVAPLFVTRQSLPPPLERSGSIAANVAFMTACRSDELAEDGQTNGAFTGSQLLSLASTVTTWGGWYKAIQAYMLRSFPRQHPQWIEVGANPIESQLLR